MSQKSRPSALIRTLVSSTMFTLVFIFVASSSLKAQEENTSLVVQLIDRVGNLEEENRNFRGQLEEAHHEIDQLTKRMETLSADVDYRLNNAESGGMPGGVPSSSERVSPTSSSSKREGDSSSPSSSKRGEESSGPSSSDAYEKARNLLEQGDYKAAEHAFSSFVISYPKDEQAGAAQYWYGVTFFARGEYEKAATAFAKGYKNYPKSPKAPDMLLKLAKSLGELDRNADACTALDQLTSEYPKALKSEAAAEKKKRKCK
ncbi:MAG: tol-pal system protein YbgF [Alphaproteobacteria bacterium]|nr:tol-pal system protein YbgF [Alphaproteobacteria bacterium]